jgi:hypothetical protein
MVAKGRFHKKVLLFSPFYNLKYLMTYQLVITNCKLYDLWDRIFERIADRIDDYLIPLCNISYSKYGQFSTEIWHCKIFPVWIT